MIHVEFTALEGVLLVTPQVHADSRGFTVETSSDRELRANGITDRFVQDNHSRSGPGTLRGLHFQAPPGQAKLVRVARGAIQDVVVDIRRRSPTFGQHVTFTLDDTHHRQLYVPAGFAHGFCVVGDGADILYRLSRYYDPSLEHGIAWDDPALAIGWAIRGPILSERDRHHPSLGDLSPELTDW